MSYKTLGELVNIKGGKRLPKGAQLQSEPNSHPYIRVRDMGDKYIPEHGLEYVPDDVFPSISRYIVNTNDVIISIVGTIGLVSIIDERFDNASQTENCAKLSGLDYVDANYVYYFLNSSVGQQEIRQGTVGAVQAKLPLYSIEKIKVYWPARFEREKIVDQLATIDRKLGLNVQTNQTLEQMAQAIFKSWFVDFDPVKAKMNGDQPEGMDAATTSLFPEKLVESELGLIPDGWEAKQLKDILELAYGKALKKTDRVEGDVPVYGSGGLTGYHNQSLVEGPGIIVGRKGTVGSVYWEPKAFYPIDTVFYVKPKAGYSLNYCYLILQNLGLKNMNTDAAVPGLNRNNAYRLEVVTPSHGVLNKFESLMSAFQSKIDGNNAENSSLETLRDTLLPKLLSGEIELEESGVVEENDVANRLLKQMDFGVKSRPRQNPIPDGSIGYITTSGIFGSDGGTFVNIPKAVQALTKITSADGTYGELAGNALTENVLSGTVEIVTNNIIPLGVLTKICTAVFGKKTPIKPRNAVLLTSIHQAKNKTLDGIMNEQAKRFAFLEQSSMDEQEFGESLQYLESIGVVKCEGQQITLLDTIVQH